MCSEEARIFMPACQRKMLFLIRIVQNSLYHFFIKIEFYREKELFNSHICLSQNSSAHNDHRFDTKVLVIAKDLVELPNGICQSEVR